MKIKLISINPRIINNTESKLSKLEDHTNKNIKKLHNSLIECNEEIDILSYFTNDDQEITNYIKCLKHELSEYKHKEKSAIKELKKIKKRKKYINFIKKINY